MKLFYKVAALLVLAAAVPLGVVGFSLVAAHERAHEAEVRARFDETARHAAERVATDVEGRARLLGQTTAMFPWGGLHAEEVRGALSLLRRQSGALAATFEDGKNEAVRDADPRAPELGAVLAEKAPRERARAEGRGAVVFSPTFEVPRIGPVLAAALEVPGGLVLLALPLAPSARRLDEARGEQPLAITLVGAAGELLAQSRAPGAHERPAASVLADAAAGHDGHARRHTDGDRTLVAAFAPVGGLGWHVIVEEDAALAFAAPRRMRTLTLAVTGGAAVLALALAFVFARRLTSALERLTAAARALGRGELSTRVEEKGDDEVSALARTFNAMGGEIEKKRAEIEAWNRELESRVEARTQELKDAQAQLVQAQKLAALGQLGAGVAHEIRNPLGGVIGHVQLLLSSRTAADKDWESLKCIDEAARRASEVVQNLLRFSVQRKEPVRTSVDLNRLVGDTLSLTSALLEEEKVKLVLELAPTPPKALADQGQVAQVLLNLVSNARTAMKGGGTLRVATRSEGKEVALSVSDTGKGIAPEIRDKIFEPFFTTKDEWSNVGLGLSVSYRIVADHGGRIDVQSEPGRGATFTVYLPA